MSCETAYAPAPDQLLTAKELGFRLGVPITQVLKWISTSGLTCRGSAPATTGPKKLLGVYSLQAASRLAAIYHERKATRVAGGTA